MGRAARTVARCNGQRALQGPKAGESGDVKHKHQRALQGKNASKYPPMLEFFLWVTFIHVPNDILIRVQFMQEPMHQRRKYHACTYYQHQT